MSNVTKFGAAIKLGQYGAAQTPDVTDTGVIYLDNDGTIKFRESGTWEQLGKQSDVDANTGDISTLQSDVLTLQTGYSRRTKVQSIEASDTDPAGLADGRYILDADAQTIDPAYTSAGIIKGDIFTVATGVPTKDVTPVEGYVVYVDLDNKDALFTDDAGANWELRAVSISNIADASDVTITLAEDNDFLVYDTGQWVDKTTTEVKTALAISNTDVSGLGGLATLSSVGTAQIDADSVTNAELANMAANSIKVNNTGTAGDPVDLAMGASTMLARLATGDVVAATPAEIATLLALDSTDISDFETAVRGTDLLGFTSGAGTITAADTVLSALQKLDGNIAADAGGDFKSDGSVDMTGNLTPDATASNLNVGAASSKVFNTAYFQTYSINDGGTQRGTLSTGAGAVNLQGSFSNGVTLETIANTVQSGDISIATRTPSTSGDSGNIQLEVEPDNGGTRGSINFVDGSEGTIGHIWTSTGINGEGNWAGLDLTSSSIDELSDVDTTTAAPNVGEILKWDGSNWIPGIDSAADNLGDHTATEDLKMEGFNIVNNNTTTRDLSVSAGDAAGASGLDGGSLTLSAGAGDGAGASGNVTVEGDLFEIKASIDLYDGATLIGIIEADAAGKELLIDTDRAGDAISFATAAQTTDTEAAGDINITAGTSSGASAGSDGGSLKLTAGNALGGGLDGSIILKSGGVDFQNSAGTLVGEIQDNGSGGLLIQSDTNDNLELTAQGTGSVVITGDLLEVKASVDLYDGANLVGIIEADNGAGELLIDAENGISHKITTLSDGTVDSGDIVLTTTDTTGVRGQTIVNTGEFIRTQDGTNGIQEIYVDSMAIAASGGSALTDIAFDVTEFAAAEITFMIVEGSERRLGTLRVTHDGTSPVVSEVNVETANLQINFTAAIATNTLTITANNTGATAATMRADVKLFRI